MLESTANISSFFIKVVFNQRGGRGKTERRSEVHVRGTLRSLRDRSGQRRAASARFGNHRHQRRRRPCFPGSRAGDGHGRHHFAVGIVRLPRVDRGHSHHLYIQKVSICIQRTNLHMIYTSFHSRRIKYNTINKHKHI